MAATRGSVLIQHQSWHFPDIWKRSGAHSSSEPIDNVEREFSVDNSPESHARKAESEDGE